MAELRANGRPVRTLGRREFVAVFGSIYEHSPWVAEQVYDAGLDASFTNLGDISVLMRSIVDRAGPERQLALLRAHPHLADGLKLQDLTEASAEEQQSAGLDNCTPAELEKFQEYNRLYIEKFGFPFIVAVAGKSRGEILEFFENRLGNNKEEEFQTGLSEVHKIARIRLEKMITRNG